MNIYKERERQLKHSGFTLIETFVAITILMITVLGPMTLLSQALQESRYIKDEITATFLAQEGTEIIIHGRNEGKSFSTLGLLALDNSCLLKFDNGLGYNCNGSLSTIFTRDISVVLYGSGNQYLITSKVSRTGFLNKDIISKSVIFVY